MANPCKFDVLEDQLEQIGARESEARKVFTNPSSSIYERKAAMEFLNYNTVYINGIILAIAALTKSTEKADYYREFYDQARSNAGLEGIKFTPIE